MSYAELTGNQAISLFRDIVDDQSVGDDIILSYLNTAQDELALERAWIWLIGVDTSLTWLGSDTYLTAHTWPTAVLYPLELYVEGFDFPFRECPLNMRERYKNISYRHYHNHNTRSLYLTGTTSQSRNIVFNHVIRPTEIAADATAIANWPGTTHRFLVYHAVRLWLGGTDADDITKLMRQEIALQHATLKRGLVMLDAKMRSKARNYQSFAPDRDVSKQPDVVNIE